MPAMKQRLIFVEATKHATGEDVEVGEALPQMVKGPLKLTDLILWHMGWGLQISPPGAFRLTHDIRKKIPGSVSQRPFGRTRHSAALSLAG